MQLSSPKSYSRKARRAGDEAANLLGNTLNDFTIQQLPELEDFKIVVWVYVDLALLVDTLLKTKVVNKAAAMTDFMDGFNSAKLLLDFVDVGNKKGATDGKMSEALRLCLNDYHCQQILFACSHNNDYATPLYEVSRDSSVSDRLTLLKSVPCEEDLGPLREHFRTTKFDTIFRSTKSRLTPAAPKLLPAVTASFPALAKVESNHS